MTQPVEQTGGAWNYPSVGRWGITALPEGWVFVAGFGVRQNLPEGYIVSNIALSHDPLPQGKTLVEYIAKQQQMLTVKYPEAKFAGPQPAPFPATEEAHMLLIRHTLKNGVEMLHAQNYVRVGDWIGIVTLTTPEQQLRVVRPAHEAFMKGLCILPPPPPAPEPAAEAA